MNKQDKYDELDNIVRTLDILADETTIEYYKDMINDLKYEAQTELEEVEQELLEEERQEEREMNKQFEEARL